MWVEARGDGRDALCFASDSRTLPGPIEGVTKVVLFGRPDIAAVWAGDYRYATLLLNHLDAIFTASDAMRRRDIDLAQAFARAVDPVKRHLAVAARPAISRHERDASAAAEPGPTTVLVGGYSLVESTYMLLRIQWSRDDQWHVGVTAVDPTRVVFIGDQLHSANQVSRQARDHRHPQGCADWRMEPLGAIYNACEDRRKRTIGGALQMAKVYRHGNARAYGFLDPRNGEVLVRGTSVDRRASIELEGAGLLIDLSLWNLGSASFPGRRTEATRRVAGSSL